MIRVKVIKSNNSIKCVSIVGHANYDKYGSDIVCASVSATYLCTVNAILAISPEVVSLLDNNNTIKIMEYDDIVNKLLLNMINCLEDLERQYPKNIRLNKEEIE